MKKITKNTLITSGVIALALIANPAHAGLNTFEETFKKELLKEIELQIKNEPNSGIELGEITKEIDELANSWDLKETLINELKEEVNFFDEGELKIELTKDIETLTKIWEGDRFYDEINKIYEKLDAYYEENYEFEDEYNEDFEWDIDWDFEDEYEFSFADNKDEIIEALDEEILYISYKNLQTEAMEMVAALKNENDEDEFYGKLDEIYSKLDLYYGEDMDEYLDEESDEEYVEYNFQEDKNDTIEYLIEEVSNIDKQELKTEITKFISELKAENDEDKYFEKIDIIYEKIDAYYEETGIDFDEEYEFEDNEDFDFESEKQDMLQFLEAEISSVDNSTLKDELQKELNELKKETNENNFYERLDTIYDVLDEYFEEDMDEYPETEDIDTVEK